MKKQVMILIILFLIVSSMMAVGQPTDNKDEASKEKLVTSLGFTKKTLPPEAETAGASPTGAAEATLSICSSIQDCQDKLRRKEITYSQAYDAAKVIAETEAEKYGMKKNSYESLIRLINVGGDFVGADGKIKDTVGGTDLNIVAKRVNLQRTSIPKKANEWTITDFPVGAIIQYGSKQVTVRTNDGTRVTFAETDSTGDPFSITTNELNADQAINVEIFESDESLRKRAQAKLDSQKPDETTSKSFQAYADSIRWSGTWLDNWDNGRTYQTLKSVGSLISGGFEAVASLGEYRALSNLLFPELTKEWSFLANNEVIARWADLPNFIATEICLKDDAKRANRPGQYAAFITTSAGTEQSVVAIQAERSPNKFPILCTKNKEDEWTCPKDFVCKDNTFCYKDKKAEKPEEGYFYKITWGVTAPTDEAFTPYVDESGVVTKFNVYLDDVALYRKKGVDKAGVLQLQNGGHDGGMIVRYLPAEYQQVCIIFTEPIQDRDNDDIGKICSPIITSTGGVVEFASSGKTEPVTSTSADVELEI